MLAAMVRKFGRIEDIALEKVIDAMALLRDRKVMGKVVLTMGESSGDK